MSEKLPDKQSLFLDWIATTDVIDGSNEVYIAAKAAWNEAWNVRPQPDTAGLVESMKDNKIELLEEDLECVHMWLDEQGAAREKDGERLSIVGRIISLTPPSHDKLIGEIEPYAAEPVNKHREYRYVPIELMRRIKAALQEIT